MAKANSLDKGDHVLMNGQPMEVIDREFVKPGKGGAFVRLKLRNCVGGAVLRETLSSEAAVEEASVEKIEVQFLYSDGTNYVCMNTQDYDQMEVPGEAIGERGKLLKEGESYKLISWNDTVIDIDIAPKMSFEVLVAEAAQKGNTVSGATKVVQIQNGIEVKVPLFIKQGDNIIINTQSLEYVERAGK